MSKTVKIYKDAVNTWGIEKQVCMLMEECGELIQSANKYLRANTSEEVIKSLSKLASEIADVEIMIEQMKIIGSIKQLVELEKIDKLKKLYYKLNDRELTMLDGKVV